MRVRDLFEANYQNIHLKRYKMYLKYLKAGKTIADLSRDLDLHYNTVRKSIEIGMNLHEKTTTK